MRCVSHQMVVREREIWEKGVHVASIYTCKKCGAPGIKLTPKGRELQQNRDVLGKIWEDINGKKVKEG